MLEQVIGCRLPAAELAAILTRYRRAASLYQATVRFQDHQAHLHLRGDKQALAAFLDDMVAREADCCPGLRFDVEEASDGYRVQLSVPGKIRPKQPVMQKIAHAFFPTAVVQGT